MNSPAMVVGVLNASNGLFKGRYVHLAEIAGCMAFANMNTESRLTLV